MKGSDDEYVVNDVQYVVCEYQQKRKDQE